MWVLCVSSHQGVKLAVGMGCLLLSLVSPSLFSLLLCDLRQTFFLF